MYLPAILRTATRVLAAAGTGDPGSGQAGDGGGSSTPTTATPGQNQPATPGSQPTGTSGDPATQPNSADDIRDGDWRTMRQKYSEAKSTLAKYSKLGDDPTKLESSLKVFNTMRTGAWEIAKGLSYEEGDFDEAFATNPERTITILRQQAAEAQRTNQPVRTDGKSLEDTVKELVSAQTKPFNEHINRQMTEQAMTRYANEFTSVVSADPILKDAPPEVQQLVRDYLEESLQHDQDKLMGMKMKGDFSFLKDDVTLVANRLQQVFTKWLAKNQGSVGGNQPGIRPNGQAKRPTLDQLIESPELLGDRYKA